MKIVLARISLLIICALMLVRCVPKNKIIYLQDIDKNLTENTLSYHSVIKKDDILRITVSSENMELAQPFIQFINPTISNSLNAAGQSQLLGYLVDIEGEIEFPLLGKLIAAGKNRIDLANEIQKRIREKYVKDAVVDVRIINMKVTVLGEVNRPGTFELEYNRMTILQILGNAGDLTIYGNRKNITLLRDVDGVQKSYKIDLTSVDFINSEFYFLQQNDVVIVEPNYAQVQAAGFNRNASLFVSIASVLLSLIVIVSRN
ncbi:sugar transporter [Nonlabens dokdonensis]|uniref:Sugar transporter n=1 Tax=Nonlabens dokdonensis TaxID=328515 RepID=A0A1Z8APE5_9FLAO|nr:polysaccharide biosynthesis/export family protein [Nonlabens dokdonensis]OUS12194.1 sugar transporter [Nonlabens dokdonensis]